MENIEKKQQNLAGNETKTKKAWKKPELIIIDIKNTNSDPELPGTDGELGGEVIS